MSVTEPDKSCCTSRWKHKDSLFLLGLTLLAMLVLLPGLQAFGILDPSDGLYAECSREMLEKHQYLTPSLNYEPFYEKPILIYWAIIGVYKIFGVSAWVARLPSALSGVLCIASVFVLIRPFVSRRAAAVGALVLLSSPLFAVVGHLALTDMILAWLMTSATLALFARANGGGIALLFLAYVSLGLAVLLKGPVALLLVGATLVLYLFFSRSSGADEKWHQYWWRVLWPLHPIAGLFLVALISAPWYVIECRATHGEFFQEFFIRQNLGRAAGTVNHQNPWHYYIPFLLGGLFPWWIVLAAVPTVLKRFWRNRQRHRGANQLALLCICWSMLIIVLFSALKTKLGTYILPAFPPVAILTGILIDEMLRHRLRRRLTIIAMAIALIAAAALIALPFAVPKIGHPSVGTQLVFYFGTILLLSGFSAIAFWTNKGRVSLAIYSGAVCIVLSMAVLIPAGLHQFDKIHDRPFRQMLRICQARNASVALFLRDSPAAYFYLGRKVVTLASTQDIQSFCEAQPAPHYLLFPKDVMWLAKERVPKLNLVSNKGKWYLYSID